MWKQHRGKLILTSLIILLPILAGLILWEQFPDRLATHWGFHGQADGWSSPGFAVFVPPLIMLALHWLCAFLTLRDPGNQGRNRKVSGIVLWILPVLSNVSSGMVYALALGAEFSADQLMVCVLGVMFAVIGNYLPKCRMNSTIGIKVPWAYSSEENWNATHRYSGRVWVIGGIMMVLAGLIPGDTGMVVMLIAVIALAVIPVVYSYRFYRREKQEGKALLPMFSKADRIVWKWSWIILAVLLAGVAILLFTGDVDIVYGEEAFTVEASFYSDLTVNYGDIEAIEYREGKVSGSRVNGVGSFRLLLGWFQNEEFGTYTRYTYVDPEGYVLLRVNGKILVLSGTDREASQRIFTELAERAAGAETSIAFPNS